MKIPFKKQNNRKMFYTARGDVDLSMMTSLRPVDGMPGVQRHQPPEPVAVHTDCHVGISGITSVVCKQQSDGSWECRQAIALFGGSNMSDEQLAACNHDPFHPDFHDNFTWGKGATREAAETALRQNAMEMADSLWAEPAGDPQNGGGLCKQTEL
jgi:hypothetical protein